ncbi:excinuclease ABC subunit UvrA [Metamycoplasma phocicerebrale]|uniref:UvrABC system protein A n=1 Tax=Metamycoplasma phocicerebrale TaxID=142649 RepID=A0A3T0TUQ5_9BACT|nr:excinuclease ABC subunit UvrA [Metamycoplasma phocicerebrale]AZZ65788.1 excinuclease ABC subunit UvrA [Metamycoplasma phocicerebrale]
MKENIVIKGARENNLKNINLEIPRNKFVVFTGLSGSGKSSLAFNTIYEEGRRRYVDSLSNYAKQFLGGTKKPDVDGIEGLSPAISIEQKTVHNNPRSIVGTVTEIYDYLRLLYARIGKPYCPTHKKEITAQKSRDIIDHVIKQEMGSTIYILSPIVINQKGSHATILSRLKRDNFLRVLINDEVFELKNDIQLDKNKKWNIDLVIHRFTLNNIEEKKSEIAEAIEIALEQSNGLVTIDVLGKSKNTYSIHHSCEHGDFDMPKIEPRLFSFNSPNGMCPNCKGLGQLQKASWDLICPDKNLSIDDGAILLFKNFMYTSNLEWQEFDKLLNFYSIDRKIPIKDLSEFDLNILKYGSAEDITYSIISERGNKYERSKHIEGICERIERKYFDTSSNENRIYFSKYLVDAECPECKGKRLNKYALATKIENLDIYEMCDKSIEELNEIFNNIKMTDIEKEISNLILIELKHRVDFLINVGLQYLTLNRKAETLSGGEAQRIRLATQIGANLTGVLYVLDEPSIGLHQKDNEKLLNSLRKMVDIGNSLIVVEHDEDTIRQADFIVDIGPKAGEHGGEVVCAGSLENIINTKNSITGQYLSGNLKIEVPKTRRSGSGKVLTLKNACVNNLKKITVKFPLGKFIVVTGVSGSGKSSLINQELASSLNQFLNNAKYDFRDEQKITGQLNIDKLIKVDQSPIGRTPRSNPATYTSVFDDIREIFASTEEAKIRGFSKSRFSFNVSGGRCDKCDGDGVLKIEMHFLPDVYVTCDHCDGQRYNYETLEVKYHGKNISDVLNMTIEQAYVFFIQRSKIREKLQTLMDVGLGYIKLGQNATTLSGGEAQRVKLATYLQKKPTGKSLYILDEPTTGLHSYDVQNLLNVLNRIVDNGDTVIVIEHNLDVIKCADYIIDLGPDGGKAGGQVVATGTPEQITKVEYSYTGQYIKKILNN